MPSSIQKPPIITSYLFWSVSRKDSRSVASKLTPESLLKRSCCRVRHWAMFQGQISIPLMLQFLSPLFLRIFAIRKGRQPWPVPTSNMLISFLQCPARLLTTTACVKTSVMFSPFDIGQGRFIQQYFDLLKSALSTACHAASSVQDEISPAFFRLRVSSAMLVPFMSAERDMVASREGDTPSYTFIGYLRQFSAHRSIENI